MAQEIVVEAEKRTEHGKNASRRLRRAGRIPAVLYGGGRDTISLTVSPKALDAILDSEAGENTLFSIKIDPDGVEPGRVMIVEHDVDPVTEKLMHADLMRIAMDKKIRVEVAIHTIGIAKGVKLQGGILDHPLRVVELECLPGDIPERIDIDISELELGKSYRVSDLAMPERVTLLTDPNSPVVSVIAPQIEKEPEPAEVAAAAGEAPAEPEVIKKGKEEEPEAEGPPDKKQGSPEKKQGSSEKKQG